MRVFDGEAIVFEDVPDGRLAHSHWAGIMRLAINPPIGFVNCVPNLRLAPIHVQRGQY